MNNTSSLQSIVKRSKSKEDWGKEYMTLNLIKKQERAEGRAEGRADATILFGKLLELNRIDDAKKAAIDPDYCDSLFREFGIGKDS